MCTLKSCLAMLGGFIFFALTAASAQAEETITLAVGQQRVVTAAGLTRVSIGNDRLVDVKALPPAQVLITGLAQGQTEITIWRGEKSVSKISITVTSADPRSVYKEVKKLLGDREGIAVSVQGEH